MLFVFIVLIIIASSAAFVAGWHLGAEEYKKRWLAATRTAEQAVLGRQKFIWELTTAPSKSENCLFVGLIKKRKDRQYQSPTYIWVGNVKITDSDFKTKIKELKDLALERAEVMNNDLEPKDHLVVD